MSLFGDVNPPFEDERESTSVAALTSTPFFPEETDDDCWGQVPMKASLSSLEGTKPSAFSLGGFGPGFQCESPPDTFLDFGASTLSSNNAPPAEPQSETKVKTSGSSKGEKKLKGKKGKKAQAAVEFTPVQNLKPYPPSVTVKKSPRESAMENQDILGEIFNIISCDLEEPGNVAWQTRKTLFSAARTCRIFLDPALDALWRVLPSVFPLLRVLNSFQLVNNQYILPDVKTEEWSTLERYTRRVRVIRLENTYFHRNVSPLVYFRLNQLRGSSLFPALRELCIPPNVNVDLFSPFSMLSPNMQLLELNNNVLSRPELFLPFYSFATTTSPNLTHLVLRGDVAINLDPIFNSGSLRTLELHLSTQSYDAMFFRKLGLLSNLRSLTLLCSSNERRREHKTHPLSFVQSMEILHIKGSLIAMSDAMQQMSCKSLVALTLEETAYRSNDPEGLWWTECLKPSLEGVQSLKKVVITQYSSHNHSLSCVRITPLYQLHNLEVLEIKNGRLTLSETDFIVLVSAFPKLERLSLPDVCSDSCPPISVLWQPSIIPPTLRELHICCFTTNTWAQLPVDLKNKEIDRSIAHHGLRRLAISSKFPQVSDTDVIHLARLLDSAYPNLAVVEGYGPNALNDYGRWDRVDLFRAMLRDLRRKM